MMHKIIFTLALLVYGFSFSQNNINVNKGYAAEGYDVVAYFSNQALEGNEQFMTKHEGVNYKFANAENLSMFIKNPAKFMPQYGGYCAWAVADSGKIVGIDPESYQIKDGKLYLFYDSFFANTLKKWNKNNPDALQKEGDANWETLKMKKDN